MPDRATARRASPLSLARLAAPVILALPLALPMALPAAAQPYTPTQQPYAPPPQTQRPSAPETPAQAHARVERQIKRLHDDLRITPDQAERWEAFANVMRANADHMDALYQERAKSFDTMSALDSMRSYQHIVQAHAEDLQRLVPAFGELYESLSPQQKQTADRLFRYRDRSGMNRQVPHS